jgi:hypothetical protein
VVQIIEIWIIGFNSYPRKKITIMLLQYNVILQYLKKISKHEKLIVYCKLTFYKPPDDGLWTETCSGNKINRID